MLFFLCVILEGTLSASVCRARRIGTKRVEYRIVRCATDAHVVGGKEVIDFSRYHHDDQLVAFLANFC